MTVAPLPLSALPAEPSLEELKALRHLHRAVDDLLEESLKERENLAQTFRRAFPVLLRLTGASAVALTTRNEELAEQTWTEGDWGERFPGVLLREPVGVRRLGEGTLVTQPLDVVGMRVGVFGMLFPGDATGAVASARLLRMVDTVAEQLDTVLCLVHTASEKHQLLLQCNQHLANPVFEVGMDQAVLTLAQRVRLPGFLVLYRDALQSHVLHYRTYRNGHLQYESGEQPFLALEQCIGRHGTRLIEPTDTALRELFPGRSSEAVLISGGATSQPLGKILVWSDEGFSAYAMDVLRLMASTLSQRLLDYNRERIHLSQFFSASAIDTLLLDPSYGRHLTAQDQEVGILFADINGFTRLCEQGFDGPQNIGRFVDEWSARVVGFIWEHGGVFDKMVGDCVIGLFGPPFFKDGRVERAEAALRAARDIQAYTASLSARVNLAHAHCGLFGPNRQYTAFSMGMNNTARLQSLGGFRETLVMESVREALRRSEDPAVQALDFGALRETPVKNVAQPLRYHVLR
jgi:class 3 adenylate cyclase